MYIFFGDLVCHGKCTEQEVKFKRKDVSQNNYLSC